MHSEGWGALWGVPQDSLHTPDTRVSVKKPFCPEQHCCCCSATTKTYGPPNSLVGVWELWNEKKSYPSFCSIQTSIKVRLVSSSDIYSCFLLVPWKAKPGNQNMNLWNQNSRNQIMNLWLSLFHLVPILISRGSPQSLKQRMFPAQLHEILFIVDAVTQPENLCIQKQGLYHWVMGLFSTFI